VGFSRYVAANALVALGKRDKPLRFGTSKTYWDQIRCISRKYVVLYDVNEQRAWLLDGASVLLHLLRLSLILDEEDGLPLIHNARDLHHADTADGSVEPVQVLINSMNLKLYELPEVEDITTENQWSGRASPAQALGSGQVTGSRKQTWYLVKDRVDLIYSALDEIFDHHSDLSSSGVSFKIRKSPRTQLEGFEFWDIASGLGHIRPYATTLDARGEVWVDLIRELQAIILFGRGFGDVLQPMSLMTGTSISNPGPQKTQDICTHWERLPAGYNYLATCNSVLNKILKREGNTNTGGRPWQLVRGVYIHSPGPVFESCNCATRENHICDRVLVLLPESLQGIRAYRSLSALPPAGGAVIFGQRPTNTLRKVDIKGKGKAVEGRSVSRSDEEPAGTSTIADGSTEVSRLVGLDMMESTQPSVVGGSSLSPPGNVSSRTTMGGANDGTSDAPATPSPEPPAPERVQVQRQPLLRRAVERMKKISYKSSKRKQ
jgi:hypothetical protein